MNELTIINLQNYCHTNQDKLGKEFQQFNTLDLELSNLTFSKTFFKITVDST